MNKGKLNKRKLIGKRFGHLVCVGLSPRVDERGSRSFIRVKCDCGNRKEVYVYALLYGRTKSCGCQRSELNRMAKTRHGHSASSRTYRAWSSMLDRCFNPNNKRWSRYGGRGITVCARWRKSFENFLTDLGESPGRGFQLDRRDNNRGYTPGNCRWVTARANQNNTSRSRRLKAFGRSMTLAQWSRWTGINDDTIRHRIRRGWSVERALSAGATMMNDLASIKEMIGRVDRNDVKALRSVLTAIIGVCDARLVDPEAA